jgi:hypothetical protein
VNGDNAATKVYLTKWNTGANKRDTLASGAGFITGPTSSYTQMTVPINWIITGQTPDSMQLFFISSTESIGVGSGVPAGGQLYIDDVNLNFPTTSIEEKQNSVDFTLYPNPATNTITCQLPNETDHGVLCIYNLHGEIVLTTIITKKGSTIDLSGFAKGIYIAEVTCGKNAAARKKFIVE